MKIKNIKFKAKRLDNGKWVEGYFYAECGNAYIIEDRQSESMLNRNEAHQVDPSTACQFTGLKDCEGNEIWEEDIIKDPYLGKERTIEWNNHLCSFTALDDTNGSDKPLGALVGSLGWYVVGNKFDKENSI